MYEILKAIAAANSWVFTYGRHDFNNLFEGIEKQNTPYLFLDPVKIKDIDNENGVTEQRTYAGSFMVLYSSDIDEESYDARYQAYIKPIVTGALSVIKKYLRCTANATFELWETIEAINVFDYNFDGVLCSYQITTDYEGPFEFTLTIPETDGSTVPVTGVHTYYEGQAVQVTATPEEGFQFTKFKENGVDKFDNPLTVIFTENKVVVPYFELIP